MKKALISAVVLFATASLHAQIFVGGSLGFDSQTEKAAAKKTENVTAITFAPKIGYQIDEKFSAGLEIVYASESTKYFDPAKKNKRNWMGNCSFRSLYFI